MKEHVSIRIILISISIIFLSGCDTADNNSIVKTDSQEHVLSETPQSSGQPIMVRVAVWDDTKRKPVHNRAEIWFRGHGSWWLKRELQHGGTSKNLGQRPSGDIQHLIIYPDSRKGKELKVPYVMTDEMNPNGSPRDMISVEISDTEITVHGLPVKAATGKHELKYKR